VTEDMDIVDKIASISTNEKDQPVDSEQAQVKSENRKKAEISFTIGIFVKKFLTRFTTASLA
jgi:hypothetical protein